MATMVGIINFSGLYDWGKLHKTILGWIKDHKYDTDDRKYEYAVKQFGEEIEWSIFGSRKLNEYAKYGINVELKIKDQTQVEVVEEGNKKKMDKGRIEIKVFCDFQLDYAKMFKKTKSMQKLGKFLNTRIFGGGLKDAGLWEDALYYESYRLLLDIKKNLNMETAYSAY